MFVVARVTLDPAIVEPVDASVGAGGIGLAADLWVSTRLDLIGLGPEIKSLFSMRAQNKKDYK